MKAFNSITVRIICIVIVLLSCLSCVSTKKVAYFNSLPNSVLKAVDEDLEPVIQKGDILSISVSSITPEVAAVFNAPNMPSNSYSPAAGNLSQAVGYLVDQDGNIQFPMLGNLKVAGMTKKELKAEITNTLKDKRLLYDPIVSIRYLNFHVTVLGEVGRPGLVVIPNEQVTILEAIGLAGDMTIFGKRENVMLLRKENGQRVVRRLDLTSPEVLSSPFYSLKNNDVVYVEPNKEKVASISQSRQMLPALLSGLSLLFLVVDRLVR